MEPKDPRQRVATPDIGQLQALYVLPDGFIEIQFGSVTRQSFQLDLSQNRLESAISQSKTRNLCKRVETRLRRFRAATPQRLFGSGLPVRASCYGAEADSSLQAGCVAYAGQSKNLRGSNGIALDHIFLDGDSPTRGSGNGDKAVLEEKGGFNDLGAPGIFRLIQFQRWGIRGKTPVRIGQQ